MMVGIRQDLRVDFSTEAGTAFERFQGMFRVTWRGEINAQNQNAFVIVVGVVSALALPLATVGKTSGATLTYGAWPLIEHPLPRRGRTTGPNINPDGCLTGSTPGFLGTRVRWDVITVIPLPLAIVVNLLVLSR
ncbi:MAG: hypothetical protein KJO43_14410 [Phycisphaerae bacterium]|nr:hypothetical protein [Phycisphaerae bacterium]NNF43283.1 hypothetical protein [Phycisphaerales bacterium]